MIALLALVGISLGVRSGSSKDATALTTPSASEPVFGSTIENAVPRAAQAPDGMVWVPGGEFSMGAEIRRAWTRSA